MQQAPSVASRVDSFLLDMTHFTHSITNKCSLKNVYLKTKREKEELIRDCHAMLQGHPSPMNQILKCSKL